MFKIYLGIHVILASICLNLLVLVQPLVFLQIYDRVIPNSAVETLFVLMIGLMIALGLDFILRIARSSLLETIGLRFERMIYARFIQQILHGDLTAIEREAPGVHLDRLQAISRIVEFRTEDSATVFIDLPFAAIFLGIVCVISPALALLLLGTIGVGLLIIRHFDGRIDAATRERSELDARRHSFLIEVLRSTEAVKAMRIEEFLVRRYERLMAAIADRSASNVGNHQLAVGMFSAFAQVSTVWVASAGAILVIQGTVTVGALATAIFLTGRILQPIFQFRALAIRRKEIAGWEAQIEAFLARDNRSAGALQPEKVDSLEVRDLSFAPVAHMLPVLTGVSFEARRGECIQISGASGSGKSLLMWLLAGAYTKTAGDILVNNVPREQYDPVALKQRFALLTNRNVMLEGTVIDNLTRFSRRENLAEAMRVSEALNIHTFFASHPQGLALPVHSGSSGLPAGVVDRIAAVRALVGKPDVVLFDEANQALDPESDERMAEFLAAIKPDVILILITRSPRYAVLADRSYRLEGGHLRELPMSEPALQTQGAAG